MKNGRIYFFLYYIQLCYAIGMRVQLFRIEQSYGHQSLLPDVVVRSIVECASVCLSDPECCLSVFNPETHGCTLTANLDSVLDGHMGMVVAKYQECQLQSTFPNGTAFSQNSPMFSTIYPECPGDVMPCPFYPTCGCAGKWTSYVCAQEGEQSDFYTSQGHPGFYPFYQVPFESSTYTFSYHSLSFTEAKSACLSINATLVEVDDVTERLFISCMTNSLAPYPPIIITVENTITPTLGQSVTLSCHVATPLYTHLTDNYWLKITGNVTNIIRYDTDSNKYTMPSTDLTILNTDHNDTGSYYCIATNTGATSISSAVTVNVTGELPLVTVPKLSYFAMSGQSVTLECTVSLAQGVYWMKKSYGILTSLDDALKYSGVFIFQPSLTIFNVQTEDSTEYGCFAYNTYGTSQSNFVTLSVYLNTGGPPVVYISTLSYEAVIGQTITLECMVSAAISVYWMKTSNGVLTTLEPDTYDVDKYSGSDPSQPSLTIFDVQTEDEAEYQCFATNPYGIDQSGPVMLFVNEVSTETFTSPTTDISTNGPVVLISRNVSVADIGTTVTLECTVSPVPSDLKISWEKRVSGSVSNITTYETVPPTSQTTTFSDLTESSITTTGRPYQEKYRGATVENPSLTIPNLDRTDGGEYRCRAMLDTDVWLSDPITLIVITPLYRWWIGLEVNYPDPRWLSGKPLSDTLLPDVYYSYFYYPTGYCGALDNGAYQILPKMECNKTSRFICEKIND